MNEIHGADGYTSGGDRSGGTNMRRTPCSLLVLLLSSSVILGCNLAHTDDLDPLAQRIGAIEQRVDALEAQPSLQGEVDELRRVVEAQDKALAAVQRDLAASSGPTGTTAPSRPTMDPDLKRRLDEAGVEIVEELVKSDAVKSNLEALGKLSQQYIEQELERAKSSH